MPERTSNIIKITILAKVLLFCGDDKLIEKYSDYEDVTLEDFKEIIGRVYKDEGLVSYVTDDHCAKHIEELLGIDVLSKNPPQELLKKAVFYKFLWDENKNQWVYRKYFTEYHSPSKN